eukprot:6680632-Prorocentrum_lima.AAC.1
MSYFLFFHIECSETFDTRSVDDVSAAVYREHFGKGCGKMALINVDFPTPELPESKVTFPS